MRNKVEVVDEKKSLEIGMIFRNARDNEFYILHRNESHKFSLVCLHDGYPWSNDSDDINDVFGDDWANFVAFKGKLTITASLGE